MKQILIDNFIVPAEAKNEFFQRMKINRAFIHHLPGFIEDAVYEQVGGSSEARFVTIAVWENAEALENARREVSAEYERQNFDLSAFLERLKIIIERSLYRQLTD